MAADNNDFTHEFQIYTTDLNAGTMGTGKFLLFDNNINAVKIESVDNIKIGGGSNGKILATDGEGNLRWVSSASGGGASSYNDLTDLPTLFSGNYNDLTNKPTLFTANQSLNTGSSVSFNRLTVTGATGIEGGEIQLAKAPSSSLAGDVIIDIYDNKIRFFESGGTSRGFYLDLTTGANNTNTNIMSDSFSGSYNDLTNKPTVATSAYIGTTQVAFNRASGALTLAGVSIDGNAATVSNGVYTNGSYANPAWITSLAYSKLTDAPSLATVATSGSYADLTSKPSLSTVATSGSYSDLTNRPTIFSGSYTDLTNKPALFDGAYLSLTGLPNLAAVATSGSYNDLSNKPSIPSLAGYATEAWVNSQGFSSGSGGTGAQGPAGADGEDGASAYEVAVANGFIGNQAAWLASLVGAPGQNGTNGTNGNDGAPGAQGPAGNDGAPGQGVPTGGTVGQILAKVDGTDYNTEWVTQTGGSGATALSGLSDVAIEGPIEGSVLTWNNSQNHWENRDIPVATQIANTDGISTYSVSVGTNGVVTMTTARGGLEFGALPEPGGPSHFHIMRPASENGSGGTDLYFGDDYNYVLQRPASYNDSPAYGVEIGANDNDGGDQQVWRFGTDGTLTLPTSGTIVATESIVLSTNNAGSPFDWTFDGTGKLQIPSGGDIVDSTGTSVLGGGSGASGFDTIMVDGEPAATADGTTQFELVAGEGISITSGSNNQITISAASNASPQYGYFTELSNTADSNRVNGEAVAMDSDGNSYVSYSYYSDNDDRYYGGVAKFSGTGTKLWSVDISSQNGDARYPEICSLEYTTLNGSPVLIAFGNYYDNNTSKDVAIMYAINPETGAVSVPLLDAEITSDFGMELKDGVVGVDGNNDPFAVVVGSTYDQKLTKTLTPLAGSSVDKVYFSWSDVNAAGLQNNDQLIYNVGGYAGLRVNAVETTAMPSGSTDPGWYGLSLTVSATESGSYVITRVNGWGGALNSWPAPQTLTILGSVLGGVDGVNDMTFDFDNTVFNDNSNNINAAVSNIQGTPVSNVYCQAWNGKDWSTEIGNPLTFEYNLNNQAFIARFGSNEWTKNVGTTDYDRLNSVAVDSDGNAYAAGYAWNNSRGSLVAKYDIDGNKQWAVYIDPSNNTGNELTSLDLLPDGDIITVDEEGTVTKLDKTDGSILWQVTVEDGPSWDGNFRGTATPDGDYIIANHEDDDYTLYVMRVSGSDGSSMWTKRITRTYGGSNGEINVEDDFDAQFIDCNATYLTISANTQPNSGNETGLVISFPINGENVNGTYGQYIITSESLDWNTESTGSITATVTETPTNVTVNELSPSKTDSTFTVNKTNIGGEEVVAAEVITWTSPNNNVWRIETYNGGASVQYWSGDDQSAKWFDIADHTSGSSDFRGAIIQYHAFIQNRGTIIGTIHLTNDYTQEEATHTEHLSGDSDLQFVTLWKCNNERGQLFFKMTNEQNWQAMIQWTSTVFYGQESND